VAEKWIEKEEMKLLIADLKHLYEELDRIIRSLERLAK
jgi:hypothetical protein